MLGPTAVGKSSILYTLFSPDEVLIISADSIQVYRELNIVSATPPSAILEKFPHVLVNQINPSDEFSVNQFLESSDQALNEALKQNRFPVVSGGTGMYLNAFLFGMNEMPPKNTEFRQRMRKRAEQTSRDQIHRELAAIDPRSAEKIHPNDLKRTIRALEIYHETGDTKTQRIRDSNGKQLRESIDPEIIGLERPDRELKQRIRNRIEQMIQSGLIEEIDSIRQEWHVGKTICQAIGYSETISYLDTHGDQKRLIDEMATNTWQLVRKQRNWFGKFPVDAWYHPEQDREELEQHLASIKESVHES